jgi:hypothetical protein
MSEIPTGNESNEAPKDLRAEIIHLFEEKRGRYRNFLNFLELGQPLGMKMLQDANRGSNEKYSHLKTCYDDTLENLGLTAEDVAVATKKANRIAELVFEVKDLADCAINFSPDFEFLLGYFQTVEKIFDAMITKLGCTEEDLVK